MQLSCHWLVVTGYNFGIPSFCALTNVVWNIYEEASNARLFIQAHCSWGSSTAVYHQPCFDVGAHEQLASGIGRYAGGTRVKVYQRDRHAAMQCPSQVAVVLLKQQLVLGSVVLPVQKLYLHFEQARERDASE